MPHRPAQPRIDPRRRRPDAFDQSADDDAVGLRQPRFQRAVDLQVRARSLPAAAPCGRRTRSGTLPDSRPSCDHQSASASARRADRRRRTPAPIPPAPSKAMRDAVLVARQCDQDVAMAHAPVRRNHGASRTPGFPAAPARPARPRSTLRAIEFMVSVSRALGSARCSDDASPRRSLSSSLAEAREIAREARCFRLAGACRATAPVRAPRSQRFKASGAPPSRHSGCLSSASSVGGSSPLGDRLGGEPRKNAGGRLQQRVAAGIVEVEVPAAQRRHHPPRQRAVRRHQRRRFVQMPRLAHRDRDRKRLHLRIGRLDHREIFHAARQSSRRSRARRSRSCHCAVAFDGRIASDTSTSRPCGAGCAENFDIAALDAEALQQRMHRELRMVRGGRAW